MATPQRTFVDDVINNLTSEDKLDNYVEYWHTHETGNSLPEFLGLSSNETEKLFKGTPISEIIKSRKD